jgi:hypothetical protein
VVVYVPVPSSKAVPWAYLAVLTVGVLALVGFFFLPFASVAGLSLTAVEGATTGGPNLWLIAGAGGFAVAVAGTSAAAGPTPRWGRVVTAIIITVTGIVGSVALYQAYQAFQFLRAQGETYAPVTLESGFWLCVLANAGLIIGGVAVAFGD